MNVNIDSHRQNISLLRTVMKHRKSSNVRQVRGAEKALAIVIIEYEELVNDIEEEKLETVGHWDK